ncbi:MAG: hypothetical protein E7350_02465 [Clostridiales bacterium]|nr:hypothetical protein [Clostridiales bacterium]
MNSIALRAYGKINLSLNITGLRGKFHTLDSVVASVSVCDTITVNKRNDNKINLTFNAPFTPQNNTVNLAVNELISRFGEFGADITVDKRLPLAGGMGGSSADAAGVIVALCKLYGFGSDGLAASAAVGSDVPYMTRGGYARLMGIGDEVEFFDCKARHSLVYICGDGVLTSRVYSQYDSLGGDGYVDNDRLIRALKEGKRPILGNMLTRSACSLSSQIQKNLDVLEKINLCPSMTGSGSTVYALSDCPEDDVAKLKELGITAHAAVILPFGIEFI